MDGDKRLVNGLWDASVPLRSGPIKVPCTLSHYNQSKKKKNPWKASPALSRLQVQDLVLKQQYTLQLYPCTGGFKKCNKLAGG